MAGTATWETQIELDIEELKKRLIEAEDKIQSVVNKPYKVELDLDTKTLESAIKKLDKMLTSLGKGTNDFKQFETLSKDISAVSKEIQSLSKAFGKIDDSGTKTLLQSIQSIDTSLSKLSEHILDVNRNMSDIGGNTSGAVKQAENIRNANEEAAKSAEKLADAQAKIGDAKKDTFQGETGTTGRTGGKRKRKDKYADRSKLSDDDFLADDKSSIVSDVLTEKGYTVLGVSTKLKNGLVEVSAKVKDLDGVWRTFSAKVDADGNMFEDNFKPVTQDIEKLENQLRDLETEATSLTSKEMLDVANQVREGLHLNKEDYKIDVDNKGIIIITKNLKEMDKAGTSVTQTFRSVKDAIDHFGINDDTVAEKTKISVKNKKNTTTSSTVKKTETDTSDIDAQIQKNKELKKAIKDYGEIKIRIAKGEAFASDEQDAKNLLETINQIMGKTEESKGKSILSQEQLDANQKRLDEIDKTITNLQAKSKEDFIKFNEKQIEKLESELKSRQSKPIPENQSENYKAQTAKFSTEIDQYRNSINALKESGELTEENKKNIEELRQTCVNTADAFKQMGAAQKGSTENSRWKEIQKLSKYLVYNTRLSKEARQQLSLYLDMLKSGDASVDVGKIHTEWMKVAEQERIAGREGKSFIDTVKEKTWYSWAGQIASMFSAYDLFNWGKQAASIVTTLNTNITDLAKVSEATTSQIYADFDSYADIAKDIGGTISDTIKATAAWSKNGYNIPDSKELARVSQLYKNVGDDIDIDSANESLISTLKGFQLEADQAEHIIDVFNEVSKYIGEVA